jgi:hypothetical protein
MAWKATLTNDALIALGAEKLARPVLAEAERNAAFKKIVRAALAGARGPEAIAALVDRRLAGEAADLSRLFRIRAQRRRRGKALLSALVAALVT